MGLSFPEQVQREPGRDEQGTFRVVLKFAERWYADADGVLRLGRYRPDLIETKGFSRYGEAHDYARSMVGVVRGAVVIYSTVVQEWRGN